MTVVVNSSGQRYESRERVAAATRLDTSAGDARMAAAEAKRERKAAKRRRDSIRSFVAAEAARWAVGSAYEWSQLYFNAYLRDDDRSWSGWAAHLSFARRAARVLRAHRRKYTRRLLRRRRGEVQP